VIHPVHRSSEATKISNDNMKKMVEWSTEALLGWIIFWINHSTSVKI
jgi:hypothetical protein